MSTTDLVLLFYYYTKTNIFWIAQAHQYISRCREPPFTEPKISTLSYTLMHISTNEIWVADKIDNQKKQHTPTDLQTSGS